MKITSTIVNKEDVILMVPEVLSGAAVEAPGVAVGSPGIAVGAPVVEVVSVIALSKELSDAKVEEL